MADTQQPANPQPADAAKKELRHYTIVPLPKIVFFYPLLIVCIVCGILQGFSQDTPNHVAGIVFIGMFLINILVISFDFPGVKALALAMMILAIVFGIILFDVKVYPILGPIGSMLKELGSHLHASMAFYFCIAAILCMMIVGGVLGNMLWNRWTIEPNRLKHKDGIFSYREYPVIDLQVDKEVDDVFEYLLLFSGSLTFRIPNNADLRLENVPFITRAERKIQNIVRQLRVKTE